jgi:hypothetical protein
MKCRPKAMHVRRAPRALDGFLIAEIKSQSQ